MQASAVEKVNLSNELKAGVAGYFTSLATALGGLYTAFLPAAKPEIFDIPVIGMPLGLATYATGFGIALGGTAYASGKIGEHFNAEGGAFLGTMGAVFTPWIALSVAMNGAANDQDPSCVGLSLPGSPVIEQVEPQSCISNGLVINGQGYTFGNP